MKSTNILLLRDCFKCNAKESVPFKKITTGEHESVTVYPCKCYEHKYGIKEYYDAYRKGRIKAIKRTNVKAYVKWNDEQDELLKTLLKRNTSIKIIAKVFKRTPGAITSRKIKLGV